MESVPYFSTFGKNYVRRFTATDIFARIFKRILSQAEVREIFKSGKKPQCLTLAWAKYLEEAEHLRHDPKVRDTYKKRDNRASICRRQGATLLTLH